MITPDRIIGGVDDAVVISVSIQIRRRAECRFPQIVVHAVDRAVVVVIAWRPTRAERRIAERKIEIKTGIRIVRRERRGEDEI